ncbi:hypothetical protein SLA2020_218930 [Shorea laevis]
MAIALKTFLLLSIFLLFAMLSSGSVERGFRSQDRIPPPLNVKKDGMRYPKFSLFHQGGIRVRNRKKLLVQVLDYDDTGPNPKHDPRKKPGGHP